MKDRISYHHVISIFPDTSFANILFLNNYYFATQKSYVVDDKIYQKVNIYNFKTMTLIAELLTHKWLIGAMDFIENNYLAATFHGPDFSHTLGIWDLTQVLAGDQKPMRSFSLPACDYPPKLFALPNQKIAYISPPGKTIEWYDFQGKIFSFTMNQLFGYHSLKLARTTNELIIASIEDSTNNIEIHIIDIDTQKLKKNFFLNQTKPIDQIDHLQIAENKYLALTYRAAEKVSHELRKTPVKYSEIWNIDTNVKIATLHKNIVEIKKFLNEDLVFLTKEGGIEYWSHPFVKKTDEVHFPKALSAYLEVVPLDNYALIIDHISLFSESTDRFFYIPPPLSLLQNQYNIVSLVVNKIAPYSKIPQINQMIHEYLGFFKSKKYCGMELPVFNNHTGAPRNREGS